MCRRMLVHLDSNEVSGHVLAQAIDIGHRTKADVRFLYRQTRRAPGCAVNDDRSAGGPRGAARELGDATLRAALRSGGEAGISCDSVYTEGGDADALSDIRSAALAWGADLVIMADAAVRSRRACRLVGPEIPLVALLIRMAEDAAIPDDKPRRVGLRFVGFGEISAPFLRGNQDSLQCAAVDSGARATASDGGFNRSTQQLR